MPAAVAAVAGEAAAAAAGEAAAVAGEAVPAEAVVEPVAEALAVVEPVALVEPVEPVELVEPVALAVAEPVVAEPVVAEQVVVALAGVEQLAEVVLVELAPLELVREQELAVEPAVALMLSNILMAVHMDGLTPTGSARECFRFKEAIGAGPGATFLIGSTNTCPSLVRMCAGTRRRCVIFSGLIKLSG
jgi:hypothetical protein